MPPLRWLPSAVHVSPDPKGSATKPVGIREPQCRDLKVSRLYRKLPDAYGLAAHGLSGVPTLNDNVMGAIPAGVPFSVRALATLELGVLRKRPV